MLHLGHVQELPRQSACDELAGFPGAIPRVQRHTLPQQGMPCVAKLGWQHMLLTIDRPWMTQHDRPALAFIGRWYLKVARSSV